MLLAELRGKVYRGGATQAEMTELRNRTPTPQETRGLLHTYSHNTVRKEALYVQRKESLSNLHHRGQRTFNLVF